MCLAVGVDGVNAHPVDVAGASSAPVLIAPRGVFAATRPTPFECVHGVGHFATVAFSVVRRERGAGAAALTCDGITTLPVFFSHAAATSQA